MTAGSDPEAYMAPTIPEQVGTEPEHIVEPVLQEVTADPGVPLPPMSSDAYEEGAEPLPEAPPPPMNPGMAVIRGVTIEDSGLLWLINKAVFHPRGYMLGAHRVLEPNEEEGRYSPAYTFFLMGDGSQPVAYGPDIDEGTMFDIIKLLMP